jgi:hypothetical protein
MSDDYTGVSTRTEVEVLPHIDDVIRTFPIFLSGCKEAKAICFIPEDSLDPTYHGGKSDSNLAQVCSPSSVVYAEKAINTAPVLCFICFRNSATSVGMVRDSLHLHQ